jgi:hypothetical protein
MITMVSVNINGELHCIYTFSEQYSQVVITLPTDIVYEVKAQFQHIVAVNLLSFIASL